MNNDKFIAENKELIGNRILAEIPEPVIKAPAPINYDLLRARLLLLTAGIKEEA